MRNKVLLFSLLFITIFSACNQEENEVAPIVIDAAQKEPMTTSQVNKVIDDAITARGNFDWKDASSQMIWSAAHHGNNLMTIGFGTSAKDFDRAKSPKNQLIQEELLKIILTYEDQPLEKVLVSADADLNLINVIITKQETIIALKRSKYIRYIEPADYRYVSIKNGQMRAAASSSSSSGCGYESQVLNVSDYTTVTPNAKVPWAFYQHNIPSAWTLSTGRNITIGIIDTGISPNQTMLGSSFNTGDSSGRTVQKFGVYIDSIWPWSTTTDGPNDLCGHGTSMASVATAPRNNNGQPVGVAYNANLITYRAATNVVIDGFQEQEGVKKAFVALGNNSNVKIISMSMGYVFSVGKIVDAIRLAYSKGKLIFCAAGTSTSFTTFVGVIFPAWMTETVAVTGVKEGATVVACDDCHTGNKVDFTIVMQRAATGKNVPVNSYYNAQTDYVGGSSVATATTAGIAALVWSKNPTWTRDQVLTKMKQSGNFYPNRSSEYGFGNVNAFLAVQ
ncbi:MAG: S8/S53 family peptidase [Flavobacterium sp.]|nr:S8/S53 family peptidase [Flavobacterium sp.]